MWDRELAKHVTSLGVWMRAMERSRMPMITWLRIRKCYFICCGTLPFVTLTADDAVGERLPVWPSRPTGLYGRESLFLHVCKFFFLKKVLKIAFLFYLKWRLRVLRNARPKVIPKTMAFFWMHTGNEKKMNVHLITSSPFFLVFCFYSVLTLYIVTIFLHFCVFEKETKVQIIENFSRPFI